MSATLPIHNPASTFAPSFELPSQRALNEIYSALEAMRTAAAKLELAIDAYDEADLRRRLEKVHAAAQARLQAAIASGDLGRVAQAQRDLDHFEEYGNDVDIQESDLCEAMHVCRYWEGVFQEFAFGTLTYREDVLPVLLGMNNTDEGDPAHVHGALIAIDLASKCLARAWNMNADDGSEALHALIVTATRSFEMLWSFLASITRCHLDREIMKDLLAGRPMRSPGELRQAFFADHFESVAPDCLREQNPGAAAEVDAAFAGSS